MLTGGPLLYAIWHRLAKKVGQFAKATKIVFTRRKAEADAAIKLQVSLKNDSLTCPQISPNLPGR